MLNNRTKYKYDMLVVIKIVEKDEMRENGKYWRGYIFNQDFGTAHLEDAWEKIWKKYKLASKVDG
jgi:hypothetical protein